MSRRSASAAVPMAVSATNRRVPADSMGWATVLLFLLVVALVAAGVVAALVM